MKKESRRSAKMIQVTVARRQETGIPGSYLFQNKDALDRFMAKQS